MSATYHHVGRATCTTEAMKAQGLGDIPQAAGKDAADKEPTARELLDKLADLAREHGTYVGLSVDVDGDWIADVEGSRFVDCADADATIKSIFTD